MHIHTCTHTSSKLPNVILPLLISAIEHFNPRHNLNAVGTTEWHNHSPITHFRTSLLEKQ